MKLQLCYKTLSILCPWELLGRFVILHTETISLLIKNINQKSEGTVPTKVLEQGHSFDFCESNCQLNGSCVSYWSEYWLCDQKKYTGSIPHASMIKPGIESDWNKWKNSDHSNNTVVSLRKCQVRLWQLLAVNVITVFLQKRSSLSLYYLK